MERAFLSKTIPYLVFFLITILKTNTLAMFPAQEEIIWRCLATGVERSYQVEELDRKAKSFTLNIYAHSDRNQATKIDVVQIAIDDGGERSLTGSGQTSAGEVIKVKAFEGTLSFGVDDSRYGTASGRCNRTQVEMN